MVLMHENGSREHPHLQLRGNSPARPEVGGIDQDVATPSHRGVVHPAGQIPLDGGPAEIANAS